MSSGNFGIMIPWLAGSRAASGGPAGEVGGQDSARPDMDHPAADKDPGVAAVEARPGHRGLRVLRILRVGGWGDGDQLVGGDLGLLGSPPLGDLAPVGLWRSGVAEW